MQDYQAALVATRARAARVLFLNQLSVSKTGKGKGKVTSSPRGIACGRFCSHGYTYGTAVTLRARAAKGPRFSGWSGACRGSKRCKVTTSGNVTVKAKFVLRRPPRRR